MSLMSMLKSIFRRRKPTQTTYTMSVIYPSFLGGSNFQMSIPPRIASMLLHDPNPQRVEIWRHCEQPSDTMPSTTGRSLVCRWWCYPESQTAATDGSPGQKQPASYGPPAIPNTSSASSCWGCTPEHVVGLSSK